MVEKLVVCVPACVWAWRREEGNTHRVSQACPEHEPSISNAFTQTHTHVHAHLLSLSLSLSLPCPGYSDTRAQQRARFAVHGPNTHPNFYRAIIKFVLNNAGKFSASCSSRTKNGQRMNIFFPSSQNVSVYKKHKDISIVGVHLCDILTLPVLLWTCQFLHSEKFLFFNTKPSLRQMLLLMYTTVAIVAVGGMANHIQEMQHVMCKCMSPTLTLKIFKLKTHLSCAGRHYKSTSKTSRQPCTQNKAVTDERSGLNLVKRGLRVPHWSVYSNFAIKL